MYLDGIDAQGFGQFDGLGDLLAQPPPLFLQLSAWNAIGHEGAIAVASFEKSFGRQAFVDPQDGVLIDGQFGGQRSNRRQPFARLQCSAGAGRTDLRGDLPRDRHAGGCFDAEVQGFAPK